MHAYNWAFDFDPAYPLHVFSYDVEGNRNKMHWHEYFEISLCVGGEGSFHYLNKEYSVGAGDIFCTNNFENHVALSEEDGFTEYVILILTPSLIADPNGRQAYLEYLVPFEYNPLEFENKIDRLQPAAHKLKPLILEALELYTKKDSLYRLRLDVCVRQILLAIVEHYAPSGSGTVDTQSPMNQKIQAAILYMNTHFGEKLTIDRMAEYTALSSSYFRHLFKENTRIPFKSYLTHLRISQAKKMLLASEKSIDQIIQEVGYSNVNQFYTSFKKHMCMTPAEYRRQYRTPRPLP